MKYVYAHLLDLPVVGGRRGQALSLFAIPGKVEPAHLDEAVGLALRSSSYLESVYILGDVDSVEAVVTYLRRGEGVAYQRLSRALKSPDQQIKRIMFSAVTKKFEGVSLSAASVPDDELLLVRRLLLQKIFRASGALHTLPFNIHYAKQSKKHSAQFIRAADVAESSENVYIIVFWLLDVAARCDLRRVVVDTSGISPIAFFLASEAYRLGLSGQMAMVDSHSSYLGLENLTITAPDDTLVLVSASTSGDLEKKLHERGARPQNIVTLFQVGLEAPSSSVFCDLSFHSTKNPDGERPIRNFKENDCDLCRGHSFPVPVKGDQFLLEPAKVSYIDLVLSDLPADAREVLEKLVATRVFSVARNVESRDYEICIDSEPLFHPETQADPLARRTCKEVMDQWDSAIARGMPVSLQTIAHTVNSHSLRLANEAADRFRTSGAKKSAVVTDSKQLCMLPPVPGAAGLVVSGCLDDPQEIMGINRDLRARHPRGNVTYVTPIFRSNSKLSKDRLVSNLTYGEFGANSFTFQRILEISLPECRKEHPWTVERTHLLRVKEWSEEFEAGLDAGIEARIKLLSSSPPRGLVSDLFWPDHAGAALRIRSDFTLVSSGGGTREISQADIFVCLSALLHSLRSRTDGKRLVFRAYEQSMINPEMFNRFNDGVIQSALLRAARNAELSYENGDADQSAAMRDNLLRQVAGYKTGGGEALMEFVIALLTGTLTLKRDHLRDVLVRIDRAGDLPNSMQQVARYLVHSSGATS